MLRFLTTHSIAIEALENKTERRIEKSWNIHNKSKLKIHSLCSICDMACKTIITNKNKSGKGVI